MRALSLIAKVDRFNLYNLNWKFRASDRLIRPRVLQHALFIHRGIEKFLLHISGNQPVIYELSMQM